MAFSFFGVPKPLHQPRKRQPPMQPMMTHSSIKNNMTHNHIIESWGFAFKGFDFECT